MSAVSHAQSKMRARAAETWFRRALLLVVVLSGGTSTVAADVRVNGWLRAATEISRSGSNPSPLDLPEGEGNRVESGVQVRLERTFDRLSLRCEGMLFARWLDNSDVDELERDDPVRLANCRLGSPKGWGLTLGRFRSPFGLLNERWRSGIGIGTFWPPNLYSLYDGPEVDGALFEYERGWFRSEVVYGAERRSFAAVLRPLEGAILLAKATDEDLWGVQLWGQIGSKVLVGVASEKHSQGYVKNGQSVSDDLESFQVSFEAQLNVPKLDSFVFRLEGSKGKNDIEVGPLGLPARSNRKIWYSQVEAEVGGWSLSARFDSWISDGDAGFIAEPTGDFVTRDEYSFSISRKISLSKGFLVTMVEWHLMAAEALVPIIEPGQLIRFLVVDQPSADYGLLSLSYYF